MNICEKRSNYRGIKTFNFKLRKTFLKKIGIKKFKLVIENKKSVM